MLIMSCLQVMVWFMTTFMLGDMKDKVTNIVGLEYLYSRVPADQLDLPAFVLEYDMKVRHHFTSKVINPYKAM